MQDVENDGPNWTDRKNQTKLFCMHASVSIVSIILYNNEVIPNFKHNGP